MREGEVEGGQGLDDAKQAKSTDLGLSELQAELKAAQARVTELEERLRRMQHSRTYRAASRIWWIRARTRAVFRRRPTRAPRKLIEAPAEEVELVSAEELEAQTRAEELEVRRTAAELPAEVSAEELEALASDRTPNAEISEQPASNGDGNVIDPARDAQPAFYYGSRGVRESDRDQSGPLRAVLLMGDVTQSELESALHALDHRDALDGEPLLVTDCDALKTLDSAGHLYEYIPPRGDWERHLGRNADDYDDFVRRRLASIAGMYGLTGVPSIS